MSVVVETVASADFHMKYCRFGNSAGKPVVIIPGLSVISVMEFAASIASRYKVFAEKYDVYVINRRIDVPEVYTLEDMARDTADAIRLLGLSDVSIISVSQGAVIAMLIALSEPGLVGKMVLAATSPCANEKSVAVLGTWVRLANAGDREGLMLDFAEKIYTKEFVDHYRAAFKKMATFIKEEDLKKFIIMSRDLLDFDISDRIVDIRCPVLVIGAENDLVFGKEASLEIAEKTGGEVFIYEGYGHGVYDEAPDCPQKEFEFIDGK